MNALPHEIIKVIATIGDKMTTFMMSHVSKEMRAAIITNYIGIIYEHKLCTYAAKYDSLAAIQYLAANNYRIHPKAYEYLIEHNNLAAIKYLRAHGARISNQAILAAIKFGRISILDFMHAVGEAFPTNLRMIDSININFAPVIDWLIKNAPGIDTNSLCLVAARTGNLDLYKLMIVMEDESWYDEAINGGHLNILEYIIELGYDIDGLNTELSDDYNHAGFIACIWLIINTFGADIPGIIDAIAQSNDLELVRECIKSGVPVPNYIPCTTNLEIVKFLFDRGAQLSEDVMNAAFIINDVNIVRFYAENATFYNDHILFNSYKYDLNTIAMIVSAAAKYGVTNNNYRRLFDNFTPSDTDEIINKLEYLHKLAPGGPDTMQNACAVGSVAIIQWLIDHNYKVMDNYSSAIINDNVRVIEYFHDNNIALDYSAILYFAAKYGAIKIIKRVHAWLLECPLFDDGEIGDRELFEQNLCDTAATSNQFCALKLLHNLGYKWDYRVIMSAISIHSLQILKYAVYNGCPSPNEVLYTVDIDRQSELFLLSRGMM